MSAAPDPSSPAPASAAAPAAAPTPARAAAPLWRWLALAALLVAVAALALAWSTRDRAKRTEQELVRRHTQSQADAAEARVAARAAQDLARESAAKTALLEARVAEAQTQRSQIEELLASVARSRDENVVADVDAAVRVAVQQSAITGSAEPLVAALKQADERLARYNQPRLERVRRAVLADLERARAQGAVDISTLTTRLDEAVRLVDELPLLAAAPRGPAIAAGASMPAPAASAAAGDWRSRAAAWWDGIGTSVAQELRSLVRVTRVDRPEAALAAPEQQFFLRENLKLRLLNARLALFARQFEIAQADLREAQAMLDHWFDRRSKRVVAAADLIRQVGVQARRTEVPRPEATLAALSAAAPAAGK